MRPGREQRTRGWLCREFVRVDNVTGRPYAGSVIVAESRGRCFEPAPERDLLFGVTASLAF
jgi:iron complex outermembrane receptor protein